MKTPIQIALALAFFASLAACEGPRHTQPDPTPPTVTCPVAGQVPVDEICNGFDDDCDGVVDEDVCNDPCDAEW